MTPSSPGLSVRAGRDGDIPAITQIINHAIAHTTGSFETVPKSEADMVQRLAADRSRYPILVAEAGGRVLGWANIGRYSDRCAYDDCGELSIYIGGDAKGRGIGTALLTALVARGWEAGFHTIIARVGEGNDASLALHRRCGFAEIGFLNEIGSKHGRRLGVHIFQIMRP